MTQFVVLRWMVCAACTMWITMSMCGCGSRSDDGGQKADLIPDAPDVPAPAEAPMEPRKLPPDAPVHEVSAKAFFEEFESDAAAAISKYEPARIRLTGELRQYYVMQDDRRRYRFCAFVVDQYKADEVLQEDVIACYFDDPLGESRAWMPCGIGNQITFEGVLLDPNSFRAHRRGLEQCRIVSNKGEPMLEYTAEQLARDSLADRGALIEKLKNRQILVRGEFDEHRKRNFDAEVAVLKSDSDQSVLVHAVSFIDRTAFENLTPGTICEFLGTVKEFQFDGVSLRFDGHSLEPLR